MPLTPDQKAQIDKQLSEHRHGRYAADITLTDGEVLHGYVTYPDVYRSDVMSAGLFLARFLFFNNGLFAGKRVLDMGCGSGLQGVVMGRYGAASGILADISGEAVRNATENLKLFGLAGRFQARQGDLFQDVPGTFDVIVFNHPFFPDKPMPGVPVSRSMLDDGQVFERFLTEAPGYLSPGGFIITSFLSLAGDTNNPAVQAPSKGYSVETLFTIESKHGLQLGDLSVYKQTPTRPPPSSP